MRGLRDRARVRDCEPGLPPSPFLSPRCRGWRGRERAGSPLRVAGTIAVQEASRGCFLIDTGNPSGFSLRAEVWGAPIEG